MTGGTGGTRYHASSPSLGQVMRGIRVGSVQQRTGINVRRGSVDVDDERAKRFALSFHEEEASAILQAAERYNIANKKEGKYAGPFRFRGMDVLRWLLREAKSTGGRICPSHAQIADALKIGLRTIRRIMKALYLAGFLEWQRRSHEVDDGAGGRTREQTSNLYRLNLPKTAAQFVCTLVAARRKTNNWLVRSARIIGDAELSLRPQAWETSLRGDGRLGGTLAALAGAIDRGA